MFNVSSTYNTLLPRSYQSRLWIVLWIQVWKALEALNLTVWLMVILMVIKEG